MTTERVICMCFGYVPIFIGGGEGLRVEQRGPVRGGKKTFFDCFLKDHPLSIGIPQKSNHQRCLGGFFSASARIFLFCQFFIVLHKIRHECIMTLHGRFSKKTKKTKHGNLYNDRST